MKLERRKFLKLASAGTAALVLPERQSNAAMPAPRIKAIAFDAFPIFDLRPLALLTENAFPGHGRELGELWRTRQFEYQWLRALSGQYADFWQATGDALLFAARALKLDLTAEKRARLMNAYLELDAWPDVMPALHALKAAGVRLALLSNATPEILNVGIRRARLEGMFDHVITTDKIKTYKPDPRAYQLAIDAFRFAREEIAFAAFAGWDAAGARWFGYRTFWVNRLDMPAEELGSPADVVAKDLNELVDFVLR